MTLQAAVQTGLIAILLLNLWLMVGSLILVLAIDRHDVRRPAQVVHSVMLMSIWPWLLCLRMRVLKPGCCGQGLSQHRS